MKIKLVKHWQTYRPGSEIEPGDGVANLLIRRGVAVQAEAPPPMQTASKTEQSWRKSRR